MSYIIYHGELFIFLNPLEWCYYCSRTINPCSITTPDFSLDTAAGALCQHYFRPRFSLFSRKPITAGCCYMRVTSVSEFQYVGRQSRGCTTKVFRRPQKSMRWSNNYNRVKISRSRRKPPCNHSSCALYSLGREKSFVIIHNQHPDHINPWKYCMNYDCSRAYDVLVPWDFS